MSLDGQPKYEKTAMTLEEVIEKIEKHGGRGPVDFTNCTFKELINLRDMEILHSLDFRYSVFEEDLILCSAVMYGSFIELTGTELRGGVAFTGMKSKYSGSMGDKGTGIFLRRAKIWGSIGLNGAGPISTLAVHSNEYHPLPGAGEGSTAGKLLTAGADIERFFVQGE